jgi:hypothetical protein
MRIVPGFCGIEMTYDDVRCENLFRDRTIQSIRSALHKSASRNPNENSQSDCCSTQEDPPAPKRGGSLSGDVGQ